MENESTTQAAADANRSAASTACAAGIAARLAFAAVFVVNVQCALSFVLLPASFTGAYELSGIAGQTAVRGIGIAFLMWNATYPPVIVDPWRYRAIAIVVLAQQVIGLVGESALLATLPLGHKVLAASVMRFIAFDAVGLMLMASSFTWLAVANRKSGKHNAGR